MSTEELLRAVAIIKRAGLHVIGTRRRFWISTTLSFVADIVIPGAVIVFRREKGRAIRERAFRFMGFNYYEVESAEEVANIVASMPEEADEWEGIIKPIPPPPSPERLPRNSEFIVLSAAKATSKVETEGISREVLANALGGPELLLHGLTDKVALNDFGLTLTPLGPSRLDFRKSARRLAKWIGLEDELFGDSGGQTIRNLLTLSAPNFIKNLVFLGGPRIRPGIIALSGSGELSELMDSFSSAMSEVGVYLDAEETLKVVCNTYKKLKSDKFLWLEESCSLL